MASTETYLSPLEKEALAYAKELGKPTLTDLTEQFAAQHGIDSKPLYAQREKPEPHWAELPPADDETASTFAARQMYRVGFAMLSVVDVVGEYLASGLGITKPRYDAVLDDFVRQHHDELLARQERRQADAAFVQQADDLETGVEDLSQHKTVQVPVMSTAPNTPVFVSSNEDHSANVPTSQV
eukprot:m.30004 g.30004  ORF g.30004 m.30004 type:complete len:183 (-) comp11998_c0_seq1:676-1224(-)